MSRKEADVSSRVWGLALCLEGASWVKRGWVRLAGCCSAFLLQRAEIRGLSLTGTGTMGRQPGLAAGTYLSERATRQDLAAAVGGLG